MYFYCLLYKFIIFFRYHIRLKNMTVNLSTVTAIKIIWLICCYPNIVSLSLTRHIQIPITRYLSGTSVSDSCSRCQSTAIPLLSMDIHHRWERTSPFGNYILSCIPIIFNNNTEPISILKNLFSDNQFSHNV